MKIHVPADKSIGKFDRFIIPGDIFKGVDQAGNFEVENLIPHTTWKPGKVVLRVKLSNNYSVKLRRFNSPARALGVAKYLDVLCSIHFPRVLFQQGNWICKEWVDGIFLDKYYFKKNSNLNSPYLASLAQFQATIHRETRQRIASTARQEKLAKHVKKTFYQWVIKLAQSLILTDQDIKKITNVVKKSNIENSAVSIIHGDLSLKNVVFQAESPVSIDNEHLRLHFSDYGFWKAVYYLKLDAASAKYLAEYRKIDDRDSLVQNETFWQLYNLVEDIYLRKFVNYVGFQPQGAILKQFLNSGWVWGVVHNE